MARDTDLRPVTSSLFLLPVRTRVPLKFGPETLTEVTCARVRLAVQDRRGRRAEGWGETPLSVQWGWPSTLSVAERLDAMVKFCRHLATEWVDPAHEPGHPMEFGSTLLEEALAPGLRNFNAQSRDGREPMTWLA